jgi:general secretion pathway protein G
MRHSDTQTGRQGFTIIELLIAIIIIGILVAVIIPVLVNRTEEARIAAAQSDIEHLRGALERSAIDTGYFFRMFALDDKIGGNNIYNPIDPADYDGIRDEEFNNQVAVPRKLFIRVSTGDFVAVADAIGLFDRLATNETAFGWQGPYINYHRFRDIDYNDIPEDPWGNEYEMFTQEGYVNQYLGVIQDTYFYFADDIGSTASLSSPFFDRPTVISWGPNGGPGDSTSLAIPGTDDDIFQQF